MRISDWSADVCSSDLRDRKKRKDAQDARQANQSFKTLLTESTRCVGTAWPEGASRDGKTAVKLDAHKSSGRIAGNAVGAPCPVRSARGLWMRARAHDAAPSTTRYENGRAHVGT